MKAKKELVCLLVLAFLLVSCLQKDDVELSVLQLNTWIHGTIVPDAPDGIVDIIVQTDPDVVLLCELDAGSESPLTQKLIEELGKRGKTYYGDGENLQTGILSKYAMKNTSVLIPTSEQHRPIVKAYLAVNGQTVVVYSAHLDHRYYAPYLPRGFSDVVWTPIEQRVTDADSIIKANRIALRDEAVKGFLTEAKAEVNRGYIVILGGDLNEPSHLDWQADTKDMRDHGGAVVPWDVSLMFQQAGYLDTYRQCYPNPVTHPGFTWPSSNLKFENDLSGYNEEADERDRIDFIYYYPQPGVKLLSATIVGPTSSVYHAKITPDDTDDAFIQTKGVWPSDHKGNLATFRIAPASTESKALSKAKLSFAFLTDIHMQVGHDRGRNDGLNQALDKVKTTDAAFALLGGDLMENNGSARNPSLQQADSMLAAFKQTKDDSRLKYFPSIGNHDQFFDAVHQEGDELLKKYFKDSYCTFELQGIRFFVLNSAKAVIDEKQMNWLKQELIQVPLATPIVVALHVPVYSLYYPVVNGTFVPWDVTSNYKELLAAFREHNLKLVLQGHQHLYEEIYSQGVQYITGGSVCANWWNGSYYGTEEGFLLVNISESNDITWEYVDCD